MSFGSLLGGQDWFRGAGALAHSAGTWLKLPEWGISEKLGYTVNASEPKVYQSNANNVLGITAPRMSYLSSGGQPSGSGTYTPSTGGQPLGGGQPSGDGGGGGQPPQPDPYQDYMNELRGAFSGLRSNIQGQMPALESSYNRVRGDVESAVGRARETLGEQKENIGITYGESLRNLIQSDRELGERIRNTYSALNTLDSSSYDDSQNQAKQQFIESQTGLEREKVRSLAQADREFSAYEQQANSQLAGLAEQYQSAQGSLQQALAQNRLDEAQTIMNVMESARTQFQQIQQTVEMAKINLAQLAAQGVDVVGNLKRIDGQGLNNVYGSYLSRFANPQLSRLSVPSTNIAGQGYIGSSTDDRRRMLGMA